MNIDISVLEVGDKVTLRNGKQDFVMQIKPSGLNHWIYHVKLRSGGVATYRPDGPAGYASTLEEVHYDIVAIHPAKKFAAPALDLTKARAGDRVIIEAVLTDDGVATVRRYQPGTEDSFCVTRGKIIAVEPAPEPEFDWKDVKWGMAFYCRPPARPNDTEICIYVGERPDGGECPVMQYNGNTRRLPYPYAE